MIRKAFLLRIFDAANMQRWNDKIRPVELRELDKQAHKMIIAYVLGKCQEKQNNTAFDWIALIEGGIFEFLQRLVLTDLKPQLFHRIKRDKVKYRKLNKWVYDQLKSIVLPIGGDFCNRFNNYLEGMSKQRRDVNETILDAAHLYATRWEFDIIERANPMGYEIPQIKQNLDSMEAPHRDLEAFKGFKANSDLTRFVDLCGQLRFQVRWSHLHRVPRTSVLGHMFLVAILSYLSSLEYSACPRRKFNNFFTGLFHDLPEVLTRDIIDPVKKSVVGLDSLIKQFEKKAMKEAVYGLIPEEWHREIKLFTEREFQNLVLLKGRLRQRRCEEINRNYNKDKFSPRDGQLIEACDHLTAFVEAYLAIKNGIRSAELEGAKYSLQRKYKGKTISGIDFGEIYADFD